jgi:hypothetical protein
MDTERIFSDAFWGFVSVLPSFLAWRIYRWNAESLARQISDMPVRDAIALVMRDGYLESFATAAIPLLHRIANGTVTYSDWAAFGAAKPK